MTTAHESSVPFVGGGSRSMSVTDIPASPGLRSGHGRRNLVLALAAGGVTVAAVAGVQFARTSETPAVVPGSALANAMQVRDAYVPGGSVYDSQVPAAAVSGLAAYVPGGSVYDSQVPAAASERVAYLPGGSVYDSQVPGR
jgi:hypothetical protein